MEHERRRAKKGGVRKCRGTDIERALRDIALTLHLPVERGPVGHGRAPAERGRLFCGPSADLVGWRTFRRPLHRVVLLSPSEAAGRA